MILNARPGRWQRITRGERPAPEPAGVLPRFARPLGVDVIIDAEGRSYLIELQHGFGRRGLIELFPAENRLYRKTYWRLRRELGSSPRITEGMRRVCGDKTRTLALLARHQPASFVHRGDGAALRTWLASLETDFVLAKPPRGSCGVGILVLDRRELLATREPPALGEAILLQAFVRSRPIPGPDGQARVGCIRHVVLLTSDGERLHALHLPSYWRVSPEPFVPRADKDALTANISRGAFPVPVAPDDEARVAALSEVVTRELVAELAGVAIVHAGRSEWLVDRAHSTPRG
jgi:hypothetical protein